LISSPSVDERPSSSLVKGVLVVDDRGRRIGQQTLGVLAAWQQELLHKHPEALLRG
jgi:hypothetical protein